MSNDSSSYIEFNEKETIMRTYILTIETPVENKKRINVNYPCESFSLNTTSYVKYSFYINGNIAFTNLDSNRIYFFRDLFKISDPTKYTPFGVLKNEFNLWAYASQGHNNKKLTLDINMNTINFSNTDSVYISIDDNYIIEDNRR